MDQIVGRNIDPLQGSHKRQLTDDDVASFSSINESLHEVCVLNDLGRHDLTALFCVMLDQHLWVFLEFIQILAIY